MIETDETIIISGDFISAETGEMHNIHAKSEINKRYYHISKLTSRINAMNLFKVQAKICKSSKDILLFANILDLMDIYGEIRISNISEFSKTQNVSRRKFTDILSRMEKVEPKLLFKLDRGIYKVNPFLYIGRKVRSNEIREKLQLEWIELTK